MKVLELRSLDYIIFDLETTGFYADAGDEIVEIGAVLVSQGELTDKQFHSLINPGKPIPAASSAVHGIRDADVAKAPKIDDVIHDFCRFVGSRIMVAQNAKFDMSFILKIFQRCKIPTKQNVVLDTIGISKILFPYEQYHNLDAIMARLGIARTGDRHRSIDDCKYTALALIEFIKLLEQQGIQSLTEIESAFIKPESIMKAEKPRSGSLFG